jgi:hypothetical protein
MADKSKHLQIGEYLVTILSAITAGATYHYKPDLVVRVRTDLEQHFAEARKAGKKVLYLVFSGDREDDARRTTLTVDKAYEYHLIGARWSDADKRPGSEPIDNKLVPNDTTLKRSPEVVDNLMRDIEACVYQSGSQLVDGRLGWGLELGRNRHYHVEGWDVAHAVLFGEYRHNKGTP